MTREVSFQTRARTIDHLGRGQIADAPTAVSELWKNAYDAYARAVSLHIYAGDVVVAGIFDNGAGMDEADVLNRWLVIGTESKIEDDGRIPPETFGLPPRQRQGEKGIGRLSAAFLAPATLLLSRKPGKPFTAVLVDWRLFENPFLSLDDVKLPVRTFENADEVLRGLPEMASTLVANLGLGVGGERGERLRAGWARYSNYEAQRGPVTTAAAIALTWDEVPLQNHHLNEWGVFVGLDEHGTAMFLIGVNRELSAWVQQDGDGDDAEENRKNLRQTLTAFTDPFADPRPDFDYEVWTHQEGARNTCVLSADAMFGLDDLHSLEHWIDGGFDENGDFAGQVTAFGRDLGVQRFVPAERLPAGLRDRLGPIRFCIGTFEQDLRRSTHDEYMHDALVKKSSQFGGINVYRDDLRVMPYGREEADFLGIEARRGRHAGRYFWAHRRSFGRIAFSRAANPNLKDKAGREGLIDNRARRELKRIVSALLIEFAARFFGSDAELRKEEMPEILARNAAAKAAAKQARASRRKGIRQFLRDQRAPLEDALQTVETLTGLAESVLKSGDPVAATVMQSRYREALAARDGLRPPMISAGLDDLEEQYRAYRDSYGLLVERLEDFGRLAAEVESTVATLTAADAAAQNFSAHEATLGARLEGYKASIDEHLGALGGQWSGFVETDKGEYRRRFGHYLSDGVDAGGLLPLLNLLDAARAEIEDGFAGRYIPFLNALGQLRDGIDLDSAFAATEDDRALLEDRLRDLQSVAQVGVTVEIIGHELESLESEVRRNLAKLPPEVRAARAFKDALNSHLALADRLRFLAPMKVAGYRARETITGAQIADYVREFFERTFREQRIDFSATLAFRAIRIVDIPARIYPVFLNIVNNAVYWVTQSDDRRIRLDFKDGKVVIADSGPGVDRDDVSRLFDLFFTRRRAGRGVGLYLSRVNLAVANHRIRYATEEDPKVLPGANFIIEFRGVSTDG